MTHGLEFLYIVLSVFFSVRESKIRLRLGRVMFYVLRFTTCVMQPTIVHGGYDMLDRESLVGHDDALD
jgi:hypothetical protein